MTKRQMLINYVPGEECRIAIIEDGRLEELYQERASSESHVGNIYKGKVLNVEPSIQAAFIDFGLERNGFLHISDLHPKYFPGDYKEETEQVGLKTPRRDRPPIQKCLRRGQEILVQVLKEGIGTKGPTLTTYLSIPSRYLVMMSDMERIGVSRKVEDDEARAALRDVIRGLNPPQGFGLIGRTAAIGRPKAEIKRDLAYLQRLWKSIDRRMQTTRIGELFAESDLVIRTIRDVYTPDIERIIVDDESAARRAMDFLSISNPRSGANVLVYADPIPIFHRYDIERQIETINARTVPLPSGGSLVIESTEALVAIDVNSGKSRESRDAEMTAYKTNVEAADEICRQLRLRDLGGVVVNDLIDMRSLKHRRDIEARFRDNLKRDRARTRTIAISEFGILEMTRQRMRPSLRKSIYMDCPSCLGQGSTKSPESVVLDVTRRLALVLHRQSVARVELTVSPDVAFLLLNRKRSQLVEIEKTYGKGVMIRVNNAGPIDFVSLAAFDERGGEVEAEAFEKLGDPKLEPLAAASIGADLLDEEFDETDQEQAPAPANDDETNEQRPAEQPGDAEELDDEARPSAAKAAVVHSQTDASAAGGSGGAGGEQEGGRRRRRRRRGGRGRGKRRAQQEATAGQVTGTEPAAPQHAPVEGDESTPQSTRQTFEDHPDETNEFPAAREIEPADVGEEVESNEAQPVESGSSAERQGEPESQGQQPPGEGGGRKRRRRRRGGRGRRRNKQDDPQQGGQASGGGGATGSGGKPTAGPRSPAPSQPPRPQVTHSPRPAEPHTPRPQPARVYPPPSVPGSPAPVPPPRPAVALPRPVSPQQVSQGYRNYRRLDKTADSNSGSDGNAQSR